MFRVYFQGMVLSHGDLALCQDYDLDVMVKPGTIAGTIGEADVTAFLGDFSHKLISISDGNLIIGQPLEEGE